ncbi:hypothetical protein HHK36_021592 [Tetracentron sinense]|uniref:Bulb-type lectin domain-containing protein n=1 Tax=Tetracentron sinense TaxID=13715 RepID=A0A835DAT1_TETSI|nr:hypothetical protein HHK36_021592 [Tetracentron sinense]
MSKANGNKLLTQVTFLYFATTTRHHYTRPTTHVIPALSFCRWDLQIRILKPQKFETANEDPDELIVWVANRDTPVIDTYGVLTINGDGHLKIIRGEETLIVLNSNKATTNATATLEDTGNFIMREVNSKRVLWQGFDYPTNTLLPGMKLGVNFKTGHRWSLVPWLSSEVHTTRTFTLGGDPNSTTQLFIWQRGDLYWTSGACGNRSFEFFEHQYSLWELHEKYQMKISDGDEKYFTYSVKKGSNSMWVRHETNPWIH